MGSVVIADPLELADGAIDALLGAQLRRHRHNVTYSQPRRTTRPAHATGVSRPETRSRTKGPGANIEVRAGASGVSPLGAGNAKRGDEIDEAFDGNGLTAEGVVRLADDELSMS